VTPVTGMLTMYEDQLRFDRAVDSGQQQQDTADVEARDDSWSLSNVRLDRSLINSVDVSDSSPRPQHLSSQSVLNLLLVSHVWSLCACSFKKCGLPKGTDSERR